MEGLKQITDRTLDRVSTDPRTKRQLAELQAQMAALMEDKPRRGRPPKELTEA